MGWVLNRQTLELHEVHGERVLTFYRCKAYQNHTTYKNEMGRRLKLIQAEWNKTQAKNRL